MSEGQKVYIVTDGCYSDYRIRAVFLNKADAEKYASEGAAFGYCHGLDDPEVEEWDVGSPPWRVWYQGTVTVETGEEVECQSRWTETATEAPWPPQTATMCVGGERDGAGGDTRRFKDCIAAWSDKSHEHALKIARDERARYLAEKEGVG